MDSQLLQRTRSILRTRVESADNCLQEMFGFTCKHLLVWLEANPFLAPQVRVLDRMARELRLGDELRSRLTLDRLQLIRTASWDGLAALNFAALRVIAGKHILDDIATFRAVARALCGVDHQPAPMVLEVLRRGMLWGLRAYFEEALDGQVAVLSLLKKYKQRSEWYRRAQLRALAADAPFQGRRRGEPSLMMDLYEYVHDQGVDFRIESWSASGQADLISEVMEGQRLVLDGKFARRGHSAARIRALLGQGLRQVRDYCVDHNEPSGYLVVYLDQDLGIQIEGVSGLFPSIEVGSVSISCVFVNIFDHGGRTASERDRQPVLTIENHALMDAVDAADPTAEIVEDLEN